MNTLRTRTRRFVASSLLLVVFGIGAQAFVPTAFGCGQMGGGGCSSTLAGDTEMPSAWDLAWIVNLAGVILP